MVTGDSKAQERDYLICGLFLDNNHMLIIDSRLTPVEPAVMAMKYQILYISLIVVVLAIVVALLLSRTISKPIITINNTAKHMAEGNLDVEFKGKGYLEITELNNTKAELEKKNKEIAENIFTPFFTTKRDGSGIGLAVSKQIIRLHGGSLHLVHNGNGKVAFLVVLSLFVDIKKVDYCLLRMYILHQHRYFVL